MPKQLTRLALTALFALSTTTGEAARIEISETATGGGGTLVHDGSGDVSSSDGSAGGPGIDALLLSSYGISDGNLAGDLGQFTITGLITDSDGDAISASLTTLWLIGTLDGAPLPDCSTCGFLDDVNVGSSLSLITNTQNVLFLIPIVGSPTAATWVGPANLSSPQAVPIGPQTFTYGLTSLQIAFIVDRMTTLGFGVDDVRFGLSAVAFGITSTGQQDVKQVYDLQGPGTSVPEPGSLLLLATGAVCAGLWRRKRRDLPGRRER